MKSVFQVFIVALFLFTLQSQSQVAAAVTCPPREAGDVNVVWSSDNIKYDFTRSQFQMDTMENDTQSPYGGNAEVHVGGLMKGGVSLQSQIQVATLTFPRTREVCQWIDRIDVKVTISPTIYIARDHRQGSCRHKAILDHEMKHIFADREIVKYYVPVIRDALQKATYEIGIVGPKPESQQKRYQTKINDYIADEIKMVNDRLNVERRKRQQAIDNIQEYERVAALCR